MSPQKPSRKQPAPKRPSPKRLLRRPLANGEELERLAAWVAGRRERTAARLRFALVLAAVLVAINLFTTFPRSGVEPAGRLFSLVAILGVTVLWTPGLVRKLWAHPRLVAAQRQLLRHRGLVAGEGPEALGEEIERLARRIHGRLAAVGRDDAPLADAERRAHELLDRLATAEEGATTGFRHRLRAEQLTLRSRLEAFRVALATIEVEALLARATASGGDSAEYYLGEGAREALAHAAALLEGDPRFTARLTEA